MKPERYESGYWIVAIDEETGCARWEGAGAGDTILTRLGAGEPLVMYPDHFPPTTYASTDEPTDDKGFYGRLFKKRDQPHAKWIPSGGPATKLIASLLRDIVNNNGYTHADGSHQEVLDSDSIEFIALGGFHGGGFTVSLAKEFLKEQGLE